MPTIPLNLRADQAVDLHSSHDLTSLLNDTKAFFLVTWAICLWRTLVLSILALAVGDLRRILRVLAVLLRSLHPTRRIPRHQLVIMLLRHLRSLLYPLSLSLHGSLSLLHLHLHLLHARLAILLSMLRLAS